MYRLLRAIKDLQESVDNLEERIGDLDNSMPELQGRIAALETAASHGEPITGWEGRSFGSDMCFKHGEPANNRFPCPTCRDERGLVRVESLREFRSRLHLLTPEQFAKLPDGSTVFSIFGEQYTKGVDYIDQDTRGGRLAFGFVHGRWPL